MSKIVYSKPDDVSWRAVKDTLAVTLLFDGDGNLHEKYDEKDPRDIPLLRVWVDLESENTEEYTEIEGLDGVLTHFHMTEDDNDMYGYCNLLLNVLYQPLMKKEEGIKQIIEMVLDAYPSDAVSPKDLTYRINIFRTRRKEISGLSGVVEQKFISMGRRDHRKSIPEFLIVPTEHKQTENHTPQHPRIDSTLVKQRLLNSIQEYSNLYVYAPQCLN